ncbi:hypothetical protein BYT27DRAFT_7254895 [Phlegmacium glaucopus]|nr:hypothetical protein BYT27DRAFT_7254895 [Phlegmacium glaucopus]
MSATVIPEALPLNQPLNHLDAATPNATPTNLPRVVVDSPSPVPSPCRSPGTTSMLIALRLLEDPDDTERETNVASQQLDDNLTGEITSWSESLPTVVNEGFPIIGETLQEELYYTDDDTDDYAGNWTALSDYNDLSLHSPSENIDQELQQGVNLIPLVYGDPAEEEDTVHVPDSSHPESDVQPSSVELTRSEPVAPSPHASVGLLSPIEVSTLHLGPFRLDANVVNEDANSFDSGYADTWKPPNPLLPSPPRSPSISSTFDLLSSPFGSHSSRVLSPYLGAFIARSPVSPARTISPATLDEVPPLDLGLGSPQENISPPPLDDVENESYILPYTSPNDQGLVLSPVEDIQAGLLEDSHLLDHDAYSHTSVWDHEGSPTAIFVGPDEDYVREQVTAAIRRQSSSSLQNLQLRDANFDDDEALDHSSFSIRSSSSVHSDDAEGGSASQPPSEPTEEELDDNQNSLDHDTTAFLAYLRSPHSMENDTLNSLYDIYSDIAPSKDVISDSIRNAGLSPPRPPAPVLSNNSTPASSLRERVFTPPPPGRKRSGTITADSPLSLSSPITSINPLSAGRSSPFSAPDDRHHHPPSRTGSQSSQDEASRKVPFGFRKSYTMGRPSNSLLMSGRNLTRSVPSSPLETHAEVLLPGAISDPSRNPIAKGLKPLRLSTIANAQSTSQSTSQSRRSTISVNTYSFRQSGNNIRTSISSTTVSSHSSSSIPLSSSTRSSFIPPHVRNTFISARDYTPSPLSPKTPVNAHEPYSAPASFWTHPRPPSRISEPCYDQSDGDEDGSEFRCHDMYDETIRRPIPAVPHTAPVARPPVVFHETPRPTLMFAIASDDVEQVRRALESGDADPNECVGPQSALAFTLTNNKLTKKLDIVKTLLAYGATPTIAKKMEQGYYSPAEGQIIEPSTDSVTKPSIMDEMDLATRYYVDRADAAHTQQSSALIHRSFFRPLTRVRYELIGQDRALEQLFRVLSMHSRELAIAPIVVMLCGPSGHGKSLLARKFGSLLDVPTHTVNMTTLRSTHDLWQSYSMSPYETPTTCTLAEFLINNEGKRCVVVLDEIEKTEEKALWSLLMPWELGRCAFEASNRHVDVRNVIWLGTSNIGHDLVFQHLETRRNPEQLMTREEYVNLMALLRPKVSRQLGASILSRITTVLPFVPFTLDEKKAICSEALYNFGGDASRSLSPEVVHKIVDTALGEYCAEEGARSLYRAISNQLADII